MLPRMNTHNTLLLSGVLAALMTSSQASAAAASHQCSQLWDDTLRLGCYDTAFGKPHPPAEPVAAQTAAAPAAPAVAAAAAASAIPAATSAAPAAAAAAPAIVAAAPQAASVPSTIATPAPAAKEKPKTSEPVKSAVTAVTKALDGRFRVTLENGQVWQQLEIYPPVTVKVGEQVTLRQAALGSTQLVTSAGLSARVSLVK